MKKVIILLFLSIFLFSIVSAVYDETITVQRQGELRTASPGNSQQRIEIKERLRENTEEEILVELNRTIRVRLEEKNRIRIRSNKADAITELNLTSEETENKTRLRVMLSNGRNAEIKIMPDTASETALARLRLKVCNETNNCTIQLKEVAQNRNETRLAYEVRAEKQYRILGLFRAKRNIESKVDAETGEVIFEKKPWWSFLAVDA